MASIFADDIMTYLYLKALHIIFVITWFAGLFYIVRLFIYSSEANEKSEPEKSILTKQLLMMQSRLWSIITQPSAFITLFLGIWLGVETNVWLHPWFHLKITFVFLLFIYHFYCGLIHYRMKKGVFKFTSSQLRLWNEIATLLLFAIVFLVVLKSTLDWIFGTLGLVSLGILLMIGIKIYKKIRND